MEQISLERIKKIEKNRNTVHEKVHTTYTVFEMDGKKFVQFDTYGRIDRENPEKISQSIQLDKETASFIVKLLVNEFMN
jgi:hypothetical protein